MTKMTVGSGNICETICLTFDVNTFVGVIPISLQWLFP